MVSRLAAKSPGASLRWPGRTLRAGDGTCVSKPGSKGTDWRVHGVFDLGRGGFSHLELTDEHGAEALDRGAPIAGEIRIGDRNYARVPACNASGSTACEPGRLHRPGGLECLQPAATRRASLRSDRPFASLPSDMNPHEVNVRARSAPVSRLCRCA